MTKIYCKNYHCPENRKLESPVKINLRKFYTPIGSDNLCSGECQNKIPNMVSAGLSGENVEYSVALCVLTSENSKNDFMCNRTNCVNNIDNKCLKDEIIVDKLIVGNEPYWVCKNFSQTKISGHMDMMRLVDSDGHPKFGGHVDDDYATKLDNDNRKFKSFSGHHREYNPRKVRGKYEKD